MGWRKKEFPRVEGKKFDQQKTRLDLLPLRALEETGKVLTYGAQKYGVNNWRAGMGWSRMFGACMRHLYSYWNGEDRDTETGLSHLAHAACCLLFVLEYEITKTGTDDRYTYSRRKK